MPKEKPSAEDLDAELAALEAELAALESGKKARKSKADAPRRLAFGKKPAASEAAPTPAPAAKGKLALPIGRKKAAAPAEPAPEPPAPLAQPAEAPLPRAHAEIPVTDGSRWRQEGHAWVRDVEAPKPVVRRVLDEEGNVVREEPATLADMDEVTGVRAEKGLGRLFRRKGR